jgi:hypothetical protein
VIDRRSPPSSSPPLHPYLTKRFLLIVLFLVRLLAMRNSPKIFYRRRWVLKFSHGQDPLGHRQAAAISSGVDNCGLAAKLFE